MPSSRDNTTNDLAKVLYSRLASLEENPPSIDQLEEILRTAFLASLSTEENNSYTFTITYLDPKHPSPDKAQYLKPDHWKFTAIFPSLILSHESIRKLAPASDPSIASLAVFARSNRLYINGIVDRQGPFESLLVHEGEAGYSPPGMFQIRVLGLGHIVVTREIDILCELKINKLIENSLKVFREGNISDKIEKTIPYDNDFFLDVFKKLQTPYNEAQGHYLRAYTEYIQTISRVLLKMQNMRHGGALLITPKAMPDHLNMRFTYKYSGLAEMIPLITGLYSKDDDLWEQSRENKKVVSKDIFFKIRENDESLIAAKASRDGAIDHLASLTRVDGLVLLTPFLAVSAFGVEIGISGDIDFPVYEATASLVSKRKKRKLNLSSFGTRHRSMLRYCNRDKHAMGFVVSQDGDVRAITKIGDDVILWPNIDLTSFEH